MKKENCVHQRDCWEDICATCDGLKDCRLQPTQQIQFFMPMRPPTVTHQEKAVRVVGGKPVFYEPQGLKEARAKLGAHLSKHAPSMPCKGPLRLTTTWCFPVAGKHRNGEYRATKPDTDNLQKLLKDVMTSLGYWKDDAQVASELVEKFWADKPGIFIRIERLPDGGVP